MKYYMLDLKRLNLKEISAGIYFFLSETFSKNELKDTILCCIKDSEIENLIIKYLTNKRL